MVFRNNHGFSLSQVGLAFLGLFVGMLAGISTDPIWRRVYGRLVRQREAQGGEPGGSEPEFRLPSTILGAWVVPIALFGKLLQIFDVGYASNHVSCRVRMDHILIVSKCFWKTCWAVANIRVCRVHWIGTTEYARSHVVIANHNTTVPIIFSGIFGVG